MRHVPRARSFRSCLFPVLVVALGAGCSAESSTDDAIVSGLTSGDQVVTAGKLQLDPDMPVTAWSGPTR